MYKSKLILEFLVLYVKQGYTIYIYFIYISVYKLNAEYLYPENNKNGSL